MYRIGKRFRFEAAHSLPGLPDGHKCARPHGHSYRVEITLTTDDLRGPGFVVDFADLAGLGTYLNGSFDHRDLNTVLDAPATSENLARHLYCWCGTSGPARQRPGGEGTGRGDGVHVRRVRAGPVMTTVTAQDRHLLVAEVFGPTLQGEGPSCGQQALFLRLSRCNLSCPGCDTPYTWDRSRYDLRAHTQRRTAASLISWALAHPTPLVVISGGEPLLQQNRMLPVVAALTAAGRRVEIETNGTISPSPQLVDQVAAFNVSPKLATFAAERDARRRINPAALTALVASGRSVFKFVVSGVTDLDEIGDLVTRFGLAPVWVMPEGIASEVIVARMRDLADAVLARGWNLTTRLHVLLWEDTRGR